MHISVKWEYENTYSSRHHHTLVSSYYGIAWRERLAMNKKNVC